MDCRLNGLFESWLVSVSIKSVRACLQSEQVTELVL